MDCHYTDNHTTFEVLLAERRWSDFLAERRSDFMIGTSSSSSSSSSSSNSDRSSDECTYSWNKYGGHIDRLSNASGSAESLSSTVPVISPDELCYLAWQAVDNKPCSACAPSKARKRRRRHKRFRQKQIFPFSDGRSKVWEEKLILISQTLLERRGGAYYAYFCAGAPHGSTSR